MEMQAKPMQDRVILFEGTVHPYQIIEITTRKEHEHTMRSFHSIHPPGEWT